MTTVDFDGNLFRYILFVPGFKLCPPGRDNTFCFFCYRQFCIGRLTQFPLPVEILCLLIPSVSQKSVTVCPFSRRRFIICSHCVIRNSRCVFSGIHTITPFPLKKFAYFSTFPTRFAEIVSIYHCFILGEDGFDAYIKGLIYRVIRIIAVHKCTE